MSSLQRHHLNNYIRRYREAAQAGAWETARIAAILQRRYHADTDEQIAAALYAEGFALEHLDDLRLAAACYECAVLLTGHPKAQHRLEALRPVASP